MAVDGRGSGAGDGRGSAVCYELMKEEKEADGPVVLYRYAFQSHVERASIKVCLWSAVVQMLTTRFQWMASSQDTPTSST